MQVLGTIVSWLMARKAYILCGAIGMLIVYGASGNGWAAIAAILVAILPAFFTRDPPTAPPTSGGSTRSGSPPPAGRTCG